MTRLIHFLVCTALLVLPIVVSAQETAAVDKVDQLTVEEKAGLTTGQNAWETFAIPRLDIPAAWMADGPVGLRKAAGIGLGASEATCFPSSSAMSSTWNPDLIEELGAGIGAEARYKDVTLLLAPGLNLKRHPLGGRNFEYYSEDPLLSGVTAAAFVRGVQSAGVGATLKHYAINNQEHLRMTIDAQVDERTMHELYLRGFEIAVKEGQPQAVMSAYNRVNSVYASQDPMLLTEILRDQWGFQGLIVSDWGAVEDPVASVSAGLDLEMPGNPLTPPILVQAVQDGKLAEADLDRAAAKVLQLVDRSAAMPAKPDEDPRIANHDLARKVAIEGTVLLENDGTLPITAGSDLRIGVIGKLAFNPRIQGIGSSQINTPNVDIPWQYISQIGKEQGHEMMAWEEEYDESGLSESQTTDLGKFLQKRDLLLIFAGQPASHDAEAWDRPSIELAAGDLQLIEIAKGADVPFVVILTGGGAMNLKAFHQEAAAILMGWLGGEAWGSAIAQMLFGEASPSGRLSETFTWSIADHASAVNFPGGPRVVRYGEGLNVGYRFFQTMNREVAYPFGHGLSYTTFEYSDASVVETVDSLDSEIAVSLLVTNTGDRAGAETVQVYSRQLDPSLPRPNRELVGYQKVFLEPGESQEVSVGIAPERLAYYHDDYHKWVIESGAYELEIGASATDIRATLPMELTVGTKPPTIYTMNSVIGEIIRNPRGEAVMDFMVSQQTGTPVTMAEGDPFFTAILKNLPFKRIANFSQGAVNEQQLLGLLMMINSNMTAEQVKATLNQYAPQQPAEDPD
jgi:beta-glucosidase